MKTPQTRRTVIEEQVATDDNVRIERYDIDALRERYPEWDAWPTHTRHRYCRYAPAEHVGRASNVTCDPFHEYHALLSTLSPSNSAQLDPPSELAFGDDAASGFSTTDTSMNNEVGSRINVTDPSSSGKTFNIDEFLSSNEQNGNTLDEIGLFSEAGDMWAHSALDQTYNKDSSFALVINWSIPFADV